jgi:hypothetical protein
MRMVNGIQTRILGLGGGIFFKGSLDWLMKETEDQRIHRVWT